MSLAKEFKEFISRGNVVDLAVGVIIGGAFGAIINSLVKDVVMPPIGYIMSGIDVSSLKFVDPPRRLSRCGRQDLQARGRHLTYGNFSNHAEFSHHRRRDFPRRQRHQSLKRQEAAKPAEPPAPSAQEKLLMEIRDLLAKKIADGNSCASAQKIFGPHDFEWARMANPLPSHLLSGREASRVPTQFS